MSTIPDIAIKLNATINGRLVGEPNEVYAQVEQIRELLATVPDPMEIELTATAEPYSFGITTARRIAEELGLTRSGNGSQDGVLDEPIATLALSARAHNALKRQGIKTLHDLASKLESEMMAIPNFGESSMKEIRDALNQRGLSFKQES